MKKALTLLLAIAAWGLSPAQFSITANRIPAPGDTQFYQYATGTNFAAGATGAGATWDFSALADSAATFYLKCFPRDSTPHMTTFPSGTADRFIRRGQNDYMYYKDNGTSLQNVGCYNQVTANNAAYYNDPWTQFSYPFSLNDTNTDSIHSTFTALGSTAYRKGEGTVTIDGAGTLTLPDGTVHNGVIRVHKTLSIRDSAFLIINVISTVTYDIYEWYDSTQHLPVMYYEGLNGLVSNNPVSSSVLFYESIDTSVAVEEMFAGNVSVDAYPNPAGSELNVRYTLEKSGEIAVELTDLLGHRILTVSGGMQPAGTHETRLETSGLARGAYLLVIRSGDSNAYKHIILN